MARISPGRASETARWRALLSPTIAWMVRAWPQSDRPGLIGLIAPLIAWLRSIASLAVAVGVPRHVVSSAAERVRKVAGWRVTGIGGFSPLWPPAAPARGIGRLVARPGVGQRLDGPRNASSQRPETRCLSRDRGPELTKPGRTRVALVAAWWGMMAGSR